MDAPMSPPPLEHAAVDNDRLSKWICEARAGSPSALGRALEASRKYLLLAANRELDAKLQSKAGGSDLVQDTFVEAQRSFGAFRGTTESEFLAWLRGIMAHRVANTVRRFRQTQGRDVNRELLGEAFEVASSGLVDSAATPATAFFARDDQRRVHLALERVGEPWRSVLIERTWNGDAFSELAARRNCSAAAARMLWVRAVGKMRRILAQIE